VDEKGFRMLLTTKLFSSKFMELRRHNNPATYNAALFLPVWCTLK